MRLYYSLLWGLLYPFIKIFTPISRIDIQQICLFPKNTCSDMILQLAVVASCSKKSEGG